MQKLRDVRVLALCGLMAALAVVLNFVASIELGPYIRIGFSGVPNQIVAYLFGPALGAVFGAALDIIKFVIKPTGLFFPGFTVSAAAGGLIYGLFLSGRPLTLKNVFLSQIVVKVFVNIILNTLWLKILYNKAVLALLPGRLISNAVMLPIDAFIMYFVLRFAARVLVPMLEDKTAIPSVSEDGEKTPPSGDTP